MLPKHTPGIYDDPFRNAHVSFGQIDEGVDYGGSGPVFALGPGVITNLFNSGWPEGNFIVEKLTGGPDAGAYWYTAEHINPTVRVGQNVDTNTVIGQMAGGIETGWAAPPPLTGDALSKTRGHFQFPTPEGENANSLLRSLGAPGPKSGGGQGPGGTQTTSFLGSLIGNILGFGNWQDSLERLGLIVLGALMIIVGILLLAGNKQLKVKQMVVPKGGKDNAVDSQGAEDSGSDAG